MSQIIVSQTEPIQLADDARLPHLQAPGVHRIVSRIQARHRGTKRQYHYLGAGKYNVQFLARNTGELVAEYTMWYQAESDTWAWCESPCFECRCCPHSAAYNSSVAAW